MTVKRYRKLPVEIDAVQWTGDNLAEIEQFVGLWPEANESDESPYGFFTGTTRLAPGQARLWVAANQAWLTVGTGEWVAKDSAGFYPIKDEIFIKSYEEVLPNPAHTPHPFVSGVPNPDSCETCGYARWALCHEEVS